jgi:hypothetical protein
LQLRLDLFLHRGLDRVVAVKAAARIDVFVIGVFLVTRFFAVLIVLGAGRAARIAGFDGEAEDRPVDILGVGLDLAVDDFLAAGPVLLGQPLDAQVLAQRRVRDVDEANLAAVPVTVQAANGSVRKVRLEWSIKYSG